MAVPVIQASFAAGELSPALYARVDLAKWHIGAALLRNFLVLAQGGAGNRTGTQFIVPCLAGINRLVNFTFSVTQTYDLLFSDLKLRFITNGGVLLEGAVNITGATQANPCVLLAVAHGWTTGDWVWVQNVGGMTRLNGRFFIVTVVDANHVSLTDAVFGTAIDSTAFAAYTAGGTAARVYTLVSPYAQADLALVKFTQSADTLTLTHPNYQPRQLKRIGATNWAFSLVAASAGQAAPVAVSAVPAVGAATTTYRYVVTAVTAQGVESEVSNAVGTAVAATMSTTAAENITVTWNAAAGSPALYRVYRQLEVPGGAPTVNELYGLVGTSSGLTFVDHNIAPDFTQTPPIHYDPFAGSVWPGCTTYHQSRQVFGGATAQPETMNFSKTGDFLNFDYSSPSRANDGIVATIASRQVNAIKHMVPMQSLLVLSASGAWRVDGGTSSSVLTPATLEAVPQAFNGCSDVPPITVNYDVLYVQAKGSIVRDLAYNFYVNVYTGADMTVLSTHLFLGHTILEWAWAEEPFKIVWAVRDDGVLLSFTYLKEQDVYAWAHHDTAGTFKSVSTVSEGTEDAVYFVIQRTINNTVVQFVERMASRNMNAKPDYVPPVPADLTKAWFLDCALRTGLRAPAATLTPTATGRTSQPFITPQNATVLPDIVYSIVGADNIAGGLGYTAPTVLVIDQLGTGSGAVAHAVVNGDTSITVVVDAAGQNYQQPVFRITDATGSGAIAQPILSNDVVMNASAAHGGVLGDIVRVNDGWGVVRLVNSATQLTVNVKVPLSSTNPAASGAWYCTTPVTTLTGLDHLEGQAVGILANGNVVTDGVQNTITVLNGAVTITEGADDVLVGIPFIAMGQSLDCDIPGEAPTVQGRRKSITAVTVRVMDTRGLKVGHDFTGDMEDVKDRDYQPMGLAVPPFTGDQRFVISGKQDTASRVCWLQDQPLPATILGLIPEVMVGDTPG